MKIVVEKIQFLSRNRSEKNVTSLQERSRHATMFRSAIFAACVAAASAFAPLPAVGVAQRTNAVSGELKVWPAARWQQHQQLSKSRAQLLRRRHRQAMALGYGRTTGPVSLGSCCILGCFTLRRSDGAGSGCTDLAAEFQSSDRCVRVHC